MRLELRALLFGWRQLHLGYSTKHLLVVSCCCVGGHETSKLLFQHAENATLSAAAFHMSKTSMVFLPAPLLDIPSTTSQPKHQLKSGIALRGTK